MGGANYLCSQSDCGSFLLAKGAYHLWLRIRLTIRRTARPIATDTTQKIQNRTQQKTTNRTTNTTDSRTTSDAGFLKLPQAEKLPPERLMRTALPLQPVTGQIAEAFPHPPSGGSLAAFPLGEGFYYYSAYAVPHRVEQIPQCGRSLPAGTASQQASKPAAVEARYSCTVACLATMALLAFCRGAARRPRRQSASAR